MGADSTKTIDRAETTSRTKRMIAADTGLAVSEIFVDDRLKKDLNYTDSNIKALEIPIEDDFFNDVDAEADPEDLVKAVTVGDLSEIIFTKAIPAANRDE